MNYVFISQENVAESMDWMTRQLALLSFFHSELEKPNPSLDLEQRLMATKAYAEKQIHALTKERDALKAS